MLTTVERAIIYRRAMEHISSIYYSNLSNPAIPDRRYVRCTSELGRALARTK